MKVPSMYHEGMRHFQDHFGTRALADRLDEVTNRDAIDSGASKMIERSTFFFLATTDADGWPDCSYKGGEAGFVKVANEKTLLFPSFDGNGMYRSIGNIPNPKWVCCLSIWASKAATDKRYRQCDFQRATTGTVRQGGVGGLCPGGARIPELSALHSPVADGRAVDGCTSRG